MQTQRREGRCNAMESKTFNYNYSAKRNKEVESIRNKYIPHGESKLERLKRLDARAQSAGMIEGLSIGIVGALVFGVGTCFLLEVFAGSAWLTVLLMMLGTAIMIPAYPVYRWIARKTRKELSPEILRLSDEIISS